MGSSLLMTEARVQSQLCSDDFLPLFVSVCVCMCVVFRWRGFIFISAAPAACCKPVVPAVMALCDWLLWSFLTALSLAAAVGFCQLPSWLQSHPTCDSKASVIYSNVSLQGHKCTSDLFLCCYCPLSLCPFTFNVTSKRFSHFKINHIYFI